MSTRYVDSAVATSGNGQSWATAWKGIANISGLVAGDIVYFSGGPKGGSGKSYIVPGTGWSPAGGTAANRITYRIGQDAGHNGIATFSGSDKWIKGNLSGVTISGDAGDDARHFKIATLNTKGAAIDCNGTNGFTLSYIDWGKQKCAMIGANPIQHFDINHCYFYKLTSPDADNTIWTDMPAELGFDNSFIAFNEFHSPHRPNVKPDGFGDDFIGPTLYSGLTMHDNRFISYPETNYLAGQHQDGWQPLRADHIKIYNNYFENISNYPIYGDAYYGGFSHFYVFNNIVALTDPEVQHEDSPQGISIASEMNQAPFDNVVVAHNIVVDYTWHRAILVGNGGSGTIAFGANIGVWNNVATNNGAVENGQPVFGETGNPKVTLLNNVNFLSMPTGAGVFKDYTQNKADVADFRLVSTATALIGKGTNLSVQAANCPELAKDRDGKPRPANGGWDIGPYQYDSGSTPPIPPDPIPPGPVTTFGVTTVYPTTDGGNLGLICAQKATLAADATLQSLAFYIVTPSGALRLGLYDATGTGGNPGKRLAETASVKAVKGWNTLNVLSPVALKGGTYWLAYEVDANGTQFAVDRSSGALVVANQTYGTLPATFPASSGERANWSFYGNVSTTPPGPMPGIGNPKWNAVVGYHLYYGTSSDALNNKVVVNGCTASTVAISGLIAGTTYFYVVCPFDGAGLEGAKTAVASFVAK